MKQKFLITITFLLALLSAFSQSSIPPLDFTQKMKELVSGFVDNRSFHGCLLVAKGNNIIWRECYGYADYEKKIKNTPNTFFKIASVTKEYTLVAIEFLQKKGLINKSDFINKYFKDFPKGDRISIQQLLDHKSGIGDINDLAIYDSLAALTRNYSSVELYGIIKALPFAFDPGTKEEYSNSNYILLACLIVKVSGMDYETFLRKNILSPFHIFKTFIDHGNRVSALGYTADDNSNGFRKLNGWNSSIKLGSGCLSSTIDDVYLFLKELAAGKLAKMNGIPDTQNMINLQGNGPGVSTIARYQKDIDLYTIVLSNNWAEAAWSLGRAVGKIYENKPYTIWKNESKKVDPSEFTQWVGNYKAPYFSFKFYLKGDIPVLSGIRNNGTINYNRTYVITPLGNNEFFFPFFWAKIAFSKIDGQSTVKWTDIK